MIAALLKARRALQPEATLWRDFAYEYERSRLPFDVISGGPRLRQWIEAEDASAADLEAMAAPEERAWIEARASAVLYSD